jgi:hypothetical protein
MSKWNDKADEALELLREIRDNTERTAASASDIYNLMDEQQKDAIRNGR